MKRFMSAILSFSMALIAIAAPMQTNANEGRSIAPPDEGGGYPTATVTRSSWSVAKASGQDVTFYVKAKESTASYTMVKVTLTNAKLTDKDGKVVCNKIGTAGTCPTVTTAGVENKFKVIAGTNGYGAAYYVNSAYYR